MNFIQYEIKLLVAKDDSNNLVFIEDAEYGKDYYCPNCGQIVRCRAKNSDKVRPHFYHIDKTNCNGGESSLHLYWKYHLVDVGGTILLPPIGNIKCLKRWIECPTKDNKYRPDIVIKTSSPSNRFVILEILNSNRKNINDYIEIWDTYKFPVYEIDVKNLELDKSNLSKCMRLLYSPYKIEFIKSAKQSIKGFYKVLDDEGSFLSYEEFGLIAKSLGKIYRLLKTDLLEPIRIDLELIKLDLHRFYWNKEIYRGLIFPLERLINQLQFYK